MLAFFPRSHGLLNPDEPGSLFGTPLFALINGSAAVVLFFVLSGFVLTVRAFEVEAAKPLIYGSVKRWPRLMFPVLIVNLVSGVLAGWHLYTNSAAAPLVGSTWLTFFAQNPPPTWHAVRAAAEEGGVTTFLLGNAFYNNSLWTMYYEFFGSYLAFAVAACMLVFPRAAPAILMTTAAVVLSISSPVFGCFLAGVGLARLYRSRHWPGLSNWIARQTALFWVPTLATIFVLFGYHEAVAPTEHSLKGIYAVLEPLRAMSPLGTRVASTRWRPRRS